MAFAEKWKCTWNVSLFSYKAHVDALAIEFHSNSIIVHVHVQWSRKLLEFDKST